MAVPVLNAGAPPAFPARVEAMALAGADPRFPTRPFDQRSGASGLTIQSHPLNSTTHTRGLLQGLGASRI